MSGQKNDDSTGLMFYGARYYDATLGRFIQADTIVPSPLNPQSLNRFAYVLNNPVKYTDPTGHAEVCDDPSCGGNPPSNPSNNGEIPISPSPPPASPPVDSPTNPNPEQGDDCKRHCDDADVADSRYAPATNTPLLMAMAPRGNMCAFCAYRATTATAMGPIDDPGNGDVAGVGGGLGIGYATAEGVKQLFAALQSKYSKVYAFGTGNATRWVQQNISGVKVLVDDPRWTPHLAEEFWEGVNTPFVQAASKSTNVAVLLNDVSNVAAKVPTSFYLREVPLRNRLGANIVNISAGFEQVVPAYTDILPIFPH